MRKSSAPLAGQRVLPAERGEDGHDQRDEREAPADRIPGCPSRPGSPNAPTPARANIRKAERQEEEPEVLVDGDHRATLSRLAPQR